MKNLFLIILMLPLQLAFSPDTEMMRQQLQQQEEENRRAYIKERQEKAQKNKEQMKRADKTIQKQEALPDTNLPSDR